MKTKYEDSIIYQINSSAKHFDKLFEQFFKEIDIGVSAAEHLALMVVHDTKDCCQRDLARILLKDRANTGKLAKSLEEKGLIKISATIKKGEVEYDPIEEMIYGSDKTLKYFTEDHSGESEYTFNDLMQNIASSIDAQFFIVDTTVCKASAPFAKL